MLRRLPYPAATRTVVVWDSYQQAGLEHTAVSPEEFADLMAGAQTFESDGRRAATGNDAHGACGRAPACEPERLNGYIVSPNLFEMLGVSPALGRSFTRGRWRDGRGAGRAAERALWRRRLGEDPTSSADRFAGRQTFEVSASCRPGSGFRMSPSGI